MSQSSGQRVKHRKKLGLRIAQCWELYLFLLPAVALIFIFNYVPMYGIQIAFKDYKPVLGIWGSKWAGIKHFQRLFTLPKLGLIVGNTFRISAMSIVLGFPFPIMLALVLNQLRSERYKRVIQTVTYMPHFISTVVIVGLLKNFLNPNSGLITNFMSLLGFPRIDMFSYSRYFRRLYVLSGIWQGTGWGAIIYYAALSNINQELYESAVIDGANKLEQTWYITLPSILPTIVTLFILRTGSLLSVGFEKAYLMTTSATLAVADVISTYVYRQGLAGGEFSYATAVGLFNSVINLFFLIVANYGSRKLTDSSLW